MRLAKVLVAALSLTFMSVTQSSTFTSPASAAATVPQPTNFIAYEASTSYTYGAALPGAIGTTCDSGVMANFYFSGVTTPNGTCTPGAKGILRHWKSYIYYPDPLKALQICEISNIPTYVAMNQNHGGGAIINDWSTHAFKSLITATPTGTKPPSKSAYLDTYWNGMSATKTTPSVATDATHYTNGYSVDVWAFSPAANTSAFVGVYFDNAACNQNSTVNIPYTTSNTFNLVEPSSYGSFTLNGAGSVVVVPTVGTNPPTATATLATSITTNSAVLNGTVVANNSAVTSVTLTYGTDPTLTTGTTTTSPISLTGWNSATTANAVAYTITSGLTANTTYYYVINAVNAIGAATSNTGSFITQSGVVDPTLTTNAPISVGATTARVSATINPGGEARWLQFCYSTTISGTSLSGPTCSLTNIPVALGNTNTNIVGSFTGLTANTTYYYTSAWASSSGGTYSTPTPVSSVTPTSFTTLAALSVTAFNDTTTVGTSYSKALSAANGTGVYSTWTIASGTLPDGISLNAATGVISGTATTAGTYSITVTVTDSSGGTATSSTINIIVQKGARTITIDPLSYAQLNGLHLDWSTAGPDLNEIVSAGLNDGTVAFTSANTAVCSVVSGTGATTFLKPGTCSITVIITGGNNYNDATSAAVAFTINRHTQRIDFLNTSALQGSSPYTLGALTIDASKVKDGANATHSPTAITYTTPVGGSNTAGLNCAISGGTLTYAAGQLGSCYIAATSAQSDYWETGTANAAVTVESKALRTISVDAGSFSATYANMNSVPPTLTSTASAEPTIGLKTYFLDNGSVGCNVDAATGRVSFISAGICLIHVSITEGTATSAAVSDPISITIGQLTRTISIDDPALRADLGTNGTDWNSTPVTLAALVNPSHSATDGDITFAIDSGSALVCGVDTASGQLTYFKPGVCQFTVSIAHGVNYSDATSASDSFTVTAAQQLVTFPDATYNVGFASATLTSTSNAIAQGHSGSISVTYSLLSGDTNTANCSLSGTTLSFTTEGFCQVTAAYSSNDYWLAGSTVASFTITSLLPRTITINPASFNSSYPTWGSSGPLLSSILNPAGSGGLKTYQTAPGSQGCSVDPVSGKVTFLGAGTCLIFVSVSGSASYGPASSLPISITIGKKSRTITIDAASVNPFLNTRLDWTSNAPLLSSTPSNAPDDGVISYATTNASVGCIVDQISGQVDFVAPGICQVTATIAGGVDWNDATSALVSFTINSKIQEINFRDQSVGLGHGSISLISDTNANIVGSEPGATTYSVDPLSVSGCSIVDGVLYFTTVGDCIVVATNAGNSFWSSASTTAKYTITDLLVRQVAVDTPTAPANWSASPITLTVSGIHIAGVDTTTNGSALGLLSDPTSLAYHLDPGSSGCAITSSGVISFTGAGTCMFYVTITGNTYWSGATSGVSSFVIPKVSRTISWDDFSSNYANLNAPFDWSSPGPDLNATVSAGATDGEINYTLDPTSQGCSVDSHSGQVTFYHPGTCIVWGNIFGGSNYADATTSTALTFVINKKTQVITFNNVEVNILDHSTNLLATSNADSDLHQEGLGAYIFTGPSGALGTVCTVIGNTLYYSAICNCPIVVNRDGNAYWESATATAVIVVSNKVARNIQVDPASYTPAITTTDPAPTLVPIVSAGPTDGTISWSVAPDSTGCDVNPSTGQVSIIGTGLCKVYTQISDGVQYVQAISYPVEIAITAGQNNNNNGGGYVYTPPTTTNSGINLNVNGGSTGSVTTTGNLTSVTSPASGQITVQNGQIVYTPKPGFKGKDVYTYTITDPSGNKTVYTVNVIVSNQPPIGSSQSALTTAGQPVTAAITATDPNGDPLTYTLGTPSKNVPLKIVGSSVVASPDANFSGVVTVPVTITDDSGASIVVNQQITVNPAPAISAVVTTSAPPKKIALNTLTHIVTSLNVALPPSATGVAVTVNGTPVSATVDANGKVSVASLIGPKDDVQVATLGNDGTFADAIPATHTTSKSAISFANVNFGSAAVTLDANAKKVLNLVAAAFKLHGFTTLNLTGHTDNQGSKASNTALGLARAKAVETYLKTKIKGITVRYTLATKADAVAVKGNITPADRALNRRVEISVS